VSLWGRSVVLFAAFFTLGTVAYLQIELRPILYEPLQEGGQWHGPFSEVAVWIMQLVPTLIAVLLLAFSVYLVIGGVQEEKNVKRVRRR
jgi:amino acid transporter